MKKIILCAFALSTVLVSCYYDKADVINPNAAYVGCDTTKVSYNSSIAPILSDNGCNTCHGGSADAGGNIKLDNYTGVHSSVLAGQLIPAVRQDASCSTCVPAYPAYQPMPLPLGSPKISDCNINKIIAWVNQGAQNN